MMLLKAVLEGLGLGALLVLVCAVGIRKGAVGMVHFYSAEVQERCIELGLTTKEKIKRRAILLKVICLPIYFVYTFLCVFVVNGAREFLSALWQCAVIIFVMNLIDRFLIDGLWVGHTKAWIIPGTEDLQPYITKADKCRKWAASIVSTAAVSLIVAGIVMLVK